MKLILIWIVAMSLWASRGHEPPTAHAPEPGTLVLMAGAAAAFGGYRWWRSRR